MSLAKEDEPYKIAVKRWKGSYFDTKVHQTDFFECICGSDEFEPGNNDMTHVQCSICTIRQHAECVNFDLRDPYRGEYKCPHCWSESEPLPSKASLIVSPDSISYQWIEEIQKHVAEKGLRIFYYKGIKSAGYIQPRVLGNYDLIVTTFTVLTSETNHINLPHSNSSKGRKFRNPKRFMAIPSPLPVVEWWRICLDEAQMIEGTSVRKTAEMALSLKSVNRWCVTGTPI
ncbi:SNF2 histone linker PHD RING helicase_ E3 ubiquitin protein ligase, partial [Caligus rogercresseyi]